MHTQVRSDVALSHENMINISAQAGHSQPCDTFGVHSSLPLLAELFKEGQAAFVANIGNLVEPVTRSSYEDGSAQLPPQIGAHNVQTKVAQNLHAQDASSKGVLGRMLDALSRQAFNTGGFSITGSLPKILEGESVGGGAPGTTRRTDVLSGGGGAVRFAPARQSDEWSGPCEICEQIDAILRPTSTSAFGETIAALTADALGGSEEMAKALDFDLKETFATDSTSQQLQQVAKLVNVSSQLRTERGAYFVRVGGFDTHSDNGGTLEEKFAEIDAALRAFVNEMKSQGRWDDVTVLSASEFGRTITSNGLGTDHGWGGNHFVLGGSVNGGKIHGKYPDDLTDASVLNAGRGRIIPTTPWEGLWQPVGEWFGVGLCAICQDADTEPGGPCSMMREPSFLCSPAAAYSRHQPFARPSASAGLAPDAPAWHSE